MSEQIYQAITGDKLNVNYELKKREYLQFKGQAMKEVDATFKAFKEGKTVEDVKKPSKFAKAKQLIVRLIAIVFIIRIMVPKEYID